MSKRLSAWFHSLVRKLRKKYWLWMMFLFGGLFWDRVFGKTNHYIDSHIYWLIPVVTFLTHNKNGIGIVVFCGTILILIVAAFIETRPTTTKPHLTLGEFRGSGLYVLQDRLIGWELAISNTETRYHTIANNVRAKITFSHTLGNVLVTDPAIWVSYAPPEQHFAERVSIGMGETVRLLVCVARNDAFDRYNATIPWPLVLDAEHRLEFGEWNVEIDLSGDNVKTVYEGTLTLNANGTVTLEMES